MTGSAPPDDQGIERLLPTSGSLARGVTSTVPGTIVAKSVDGGITVGPRAGRTILFGRNVHEVHVCVGGDDRRVSRQHGTLISDGDGWALRNAGRSPLRLPGRLVFPNEQPYPMTPGYTPVFVPGSHGREHLLEIFVVGPAGDRPPAQHNGITIAPALWPLTSDERLALVVLGQRYLMHEPNPQPLTWQQTAEQLAELQPTAGWTAKRVEHLVAKVRGQLSKAGVAGLVREEVTGPLGNSLNHNLLTELVASTTLVPPDLHRLERR
ncbi:FHA domain-containing protein [Pseudonocardia sp. TRM90224]|uniref:FHA domain-containing protein n=1 Tax=Pseudonocardia sp. TRM90224 TaxID=2812678 RepID=UPI001E2DC6FC|nr:FHA domain-containing protein [Pseudonocardia sp. TRM90224]